MQHRFGNRLLSVLVTVVMIVVLSNYLLAQPMAMGRAMQGLANEHAHNAYAVGVIVLALIMVIYGTLGGLRAVAWTDAIQGVILAVGFCLLILLLRERYGAVADATAHIVALDLAHGTRKALVPDTERCREWLSYVLTVGFAISLYPQAIQRIYAARSGAALRRSLALMAFMPLPTMIISLIAGVMALAYLPGLEGTSADQIFGRLLREVQEHSALGYGLVVITMSAVLAAMMSTADSALLSISSMLTKDICANHLLPNASEATLTRIGKVFSWAVIILLVTLALLLREKSSLVALLSSR